MQEAGHTDLHQQVVNILSDVFQIDLDPSIEDVMQQDLEEWDSFNHLRLVAELEDVFQITLSDEEIPDLTSLQQVKALLRQRGITRAFETGS
jgi:acyl carrier protein